MDFVCCCFQIFEANENGQDLKQLLFEDFIQTAQISVSILESSSSGPALQMEIIGCEHGKKCKFLSPYDNNIVWAAMVAWAILL